jgi:tetratricopeptide (TPR) repeat protein
MLPALAQSGLDRANTLYEAGRFREAIAAYKTALGRGENAALAYFNMGNACFQLDSLARAIVYYRACINQAPGFFRGRLNLAVAYYAVNETGRCIAAARKAIELEPDNVRARMILAQSYRRAGGLSEAAALFERILERDPDQHTAVIALGEIYRELDDPVTAIAWLRRYPADGGLYAHALLLRAELHEHRGELAQAIHALRLARRQQPDKRWIVYRLTALYNSLGSQHVALETAMSGLRAFPDFAELALLAANIAFEREEYDRAGRLYSRAQAHGSAEAVVGLENIRLIRQDQVREHIAAQGEN